MRRERVQVAMRRHAPMWATALAALACALIYVANRNGTVRIESLDSWELATRDARFRVRGPMQPKSSDIVIVGLDDQTRRLRPELFQTRRGWAELIEAIGEHQPAIVGMDVFFGSPEVNLSPRTVDSVAAAREAVRAETTPRKSDALVVSALDAVLEETGGDAQLARAVAATKRVVLAVVFGFDGPSVATSPPDALRAARVGDAVRIAAPPARSPPQAAWVGSNLPAIADGQRGAGFVNVLPDADGDVRSLPLVIDYGERSYQTLALSIASDHLRVPVSYQTGSTELRLGNKVIPVSPRGIALLSFLGPSGGKSFPHISAHAITSKQVDPEALRGKLVLVGYTDTARDVVATPFERTFHGVELHATLLHNILHGETPRLLPMWVTAAIICALGLLLTLVFHRRVRRGRWWLALTCIVVIAGGYLVLAQVLFAKGLVIDVVAPSASIVVIALAGLTAALATEGREKADLRSAFSQYVQSTLVERILDDPTRIRLGGVRRELTVLFSDIRGFSKFSETLEPERLSSFLNEYLTPMTDIVMDAGGMLDKYIGDAIMAVFGAPLELLDHADRACDTALKMQNALLALNKDWVERGLPEIHIGVGINSGPMSVGNMGSDARFDYTVVGDAVNLGARLESLTKEVGASILCGVETAKAAKERYQFRELGAVRIQGRDTPAIVFELVGTAEESRFSEGDLETYRGALKAFRERRWTKAADLAEQFLGTHPGDGPALHLLEQIRLCEQSPPDDSWGGTFAQRQK